MIKKNSIKKGIEMGWNAKIWFSMLNSCGLNPIDEFIFEQIAA